MRMWCLQSYLTKLLQAMLMLQPEKKLEALELLKKSTLVADECKLSKLEYLIWYQVFKISKTFSLTFWEEFCTTQLHVYLPSYTLSCSGWKWRIIYLIFLSMLNYVSLSNKDSGINGKDTTICHNEASTPYIKIEYWKLAKKSDN